MVSSNIRIAKLIIFVVGFAWFNTPSYAEVKWYEDQLITTSLSTDISVNGIDSELSAENLASLRKRLDDNPVSYTLIDTHVFEDLEYQQAMLSGRFERNRHVVDSFIKSSDERDDELCNGIAQLALSSTLDYLKGHELLNAVNVLRLLGAEDSTCATLLTEMAAHIDSLAIRATESTRQDRILDSVGDYARAQLDKGQYDQALILALYNRNADSEVVKAAYSALDHNTQESDSFWVDSIIRGVKHDLDLATSAAYH